MENQEQNHQGDLEQNKQGQGSSASEQQGGHGTAHGTYNSRKPENDGHQQRDSLPADSEDLPESEVNDENEENNKDDDDFGVRTDETA